MLFIFLSDLNEIKIQRICNDIADGVSHCNDIRHIVTTFEDRKRELSTSLQPERDKTTQTSDGEIYFDDLESKYNFQH